MVLLKFAIFNLSSRVIDLVQDMKYIINLPISVVVVHWGRGRGSSVELARMRRVRVEVAVITVGGGVHVGVVVVVVVRRSVVSHGEV